VTRSGYRRDGRSALEECDNLAAKRAEVATFGLLQTLSAER